MVSRRERMLEELEQDIRDHIDRETQDNVDRGMSPVSYTHLDVYKRQVGLSIKNQRSSDCCSVSCEAALPQAIADDHYRCCARVVFFGQEGAPTEWRDAQDGKQAGGNFRAVHILGFPGGAHDAPVVVHAAIDRERLCRSQSTKLGYANAQMSPNWLAVSGFSCMVTSRPGSESVSYTHLQ